MAPLDDPTSDTERTEEDYDELEFPLSDLWHLDDMAAGEIKKDDLFLAYFDVPFSLHQLYTLSLLEPYYRTACERKAVKEFWREFCSIWAMYWREPSTKVRRAMKYRLRKRRFFTLKATDLLPPPYLVPELENFRALANEPADWNKVALWLTPPYLQRVLAEAFGTGCPHQYLPSQERLASVDKFTPWRIRAENYLASLVPITASFTLHLRLYCPLIVSPPPVINMDVIIHERHQRDQQRNAHLLELAH